MLCGMLLYLRCRQPLDEPLDSLLYETYMKHLRQ